MRLPDHLSFSSKESLGCARSYFLSRIAGAPKRPALWSIGGSAVHEATEHYDLMSLVGSADVFSARQVWEIYFRKHLDASDETEPNRNKWGRSQAEPVEVWDRLGPQLISSYVAWRERSPWTIWTTPDGEPAIELDVSGRLPGCPVEIKGFIDRVFHDPVLDKLWVLDLKTSKRPPKSAAQFETYAALLGAKYPDVRVDLGVPFMNRQGSPGKPFDLSGVSPEAVGEVYGRAWEQIQEYVRTGSWPVDKTACYPCDVQASCAAVNGPLAHLHDPASPGYQPPY